MFRTDRDSARTITLLSVKSNDPALTTGLPVLPPTKKDDCFVGQASALTTLKDKGDFPKLPV